jgi:hypothetical protein
MKQDKTFLDLYKSEKNKDNLRKEAFTYFQDKYVKYPFQDYWIIEQQERFKAKKLKFFIPGRIYTFGYNPHGIDILNFYDKRPMVFIIGQYISQSTGYNIVQGINLNFLPEQTKALFLDTMIDQFGNAYEEADQMSDKDQIALMRSISNIVTNWYFMTSMFDKRAKIGLQFATRNYDIARMIQPVLIEMEDFPMIPYFIPKEFAGKSPAAIYQLYLKSKNEIIANSNAKNTNDVKAKQQQKKFKRPGS